MTPGSCESTLVNYVFEKSVKRVYVPCDMDGPTLRANRKSWGLSQIQLAELLGVSRETIINSERRGPSREVLLLLDRAMSKGQLTLADIQVESSKRKPRKKAK